jgi:hypothetical protein
LQTRIICPYCRKPISTMLKMFEPHDPPTASEKLYIDRIKKYNYLYDENRGYIDNLHDWGALRVGLNHVHERPSSGPILHHLSINYWLRKFGYCRIGLFLALYIVSPFDIIPEALIGIVGFIDDIILSLLILTLIIRAAIFYMRQP